MIIVYVIPIFTQMKNDHHAYMIQIVITMKQ